MTKKEIIANINNFSKDEIMNLITEIESKNEHWKRCQDGSYEMALSEAGAYILWNQFHLLSKETV